MTYELIIKNKRTGSYTTILVPICITEGSTIKWGQDENNPDGLAEWEVMSYVKR